MRVLKFGGTSIANANQIRKSLSNINYENNTFVIFSAFASITNTLSELISQSKKGNWIICEQLIKIFEDNHLLIIQDLISSDNFRNIALNLVKKSSSVLAKCLNKKVNCSDQNEILAQGEILSAKIIYLYLLEKDNNVALIPATNFMKLNSKREPDYDYIRKNLTSRMSKLDNCKLFISNGFICKNHKNKMDNLGRGGSDYTATIIGNVIKANVIEIWTDIDGIHNNDPRYVENTQSIKNISYHEASELAYFGAKVLHPLSITPAHMANIPLIVKNSLNPEDPGTVISDYTEKRNVKAIAAKDGITTIKIKSGRMMQAHGFLRKVFEIFEKHETSVDMLTTSEITLAMTIDKTTHLNQIRTELEELGCVDIIENQSIICIIGNFKENKNDSLKSILSHMESIPISMISFGSSDINISFVVGSAHKVEALNILNQSIVTTEQCLVNH